MPVSRVKAKGPAQSIHGKASLDPQVFRHVLLVIKLNEIMPQGGQVEEQSDQAKAEAYEAVGPLGLQVFAHAIIQ